MKIVKIRLAAVLSSRSRTHALHALVITIVCSVALCLPAHQALPQTGPEAPESGVVPPGMWPMPAQV